MEQFEKSQAESAEGFEKWKAEVGEEIRKMEPEDRLMLVSESIRAMVETIGVGISFCLVDTRENPEDERRLANHYGRIKDRSWEQYLVEAGSNLCCLFEALMAGMRKQGFPDEKIKGFVDAIMKDVMNEFEKSGGAPEDAGAEDEGTGPSVQSPTEEEEA